MNGICHLVGGGGFAASQTAWYGQIDLLNTSIETMSITLCRYKIGIVGRVSFARDVFSLYKLFFHYVCIMQQA